MGCDTPHARDEVRFPPIPTMPSSVWRRGRPTPSFPQTLTPVIPAKAGIHLMAVPTTMTGAACMATSTADNR